MATQRSFTTAVIVGSGFGGLAMACQFKRRLNFDNFIIYERSPDLGGTWHSNTYPGCGVDVPGVLYSLSFTPNPSFSKLFPDQAEILSYLEKVAEDFDLRPHIQYNTSWKSAHWQEKTKSWLLKLKVLQTGEVIEHECKVLISAVGRLVEPNPLEIPGQDIFEGQIAHSARWSPSIVIKDKDVVVIGNGCSGSQIVPAIANEARNVYNFMRTPQYYIPKPHNQWRINRTCIFMLQYIPFLLKALRSLIFIYLELTFKEFYFDKNAEKSREKSRKRSRDYIQKTAPQKYWHLLTPKYAIGCKRRILDPGYLKALHRGNVDLTDDRIASLSNRGLITKSGKHYPADVIILANGFKTFQYQMTVVGRHGKTLNDHWQEFGGIEAYKSTALADFPNFFLLSGPNSVGGHNSSLFSIENTINLIVKVIEPVLRGQVDKVEVKREAEDKWVENVQGALRLRVYADNCDTYYVDKKTGWNFTNYPWSFYHLWFISNFPTMKDWSFTHSSEYLRESSAQLTTHLILGLVCAVGLLVTWCFV